jgi:hypothetical protein
MARKQKIEAAEGGPVQGPAAKAAAYTVGLIALAFLAIIGSSLLFPTFGLPPPRGGGVPHVEPRELFSIPFIGVQVDMGDYFLLRAALSAANVAIVLYLLFVYVRDYLRLKSRFTLGLIAFLFSFLMYALSSLPLLRLVLGPVSIEGVFTFVPALFSAIGLLIFLKLSTE